MAITDNLISYWKLDESSGDAADVLGTNTLTNSGVTYGTGKINNGAFYDNTNDVLSIADASQTGLDFTGDFTVTFWVNLSSNAAGSFFAKQGTNGYRCRIEAGNDIRLLTFEGAGQTHVTYSGLSTGSWHFIVAQRSGTTVQISVDNGSFTSSSGTLRDVSNSGMFSLGNSSPAVGDNPSGTIDEVGVWSRALTADEITTLYNSGNGITYPFVDHYDVVVNDSITITESTAFEVISYIDVSDSITITESVSMEFVSEISVFDAITITESVTVENSQLGDIGVNDAITITESVTMDNGQLGDISVFDSISIDDSIYYFEFVNEISVSDSITISESTSLDIITSINVNDSITITESSTVLVHAFTSGLAYMRSKQNEFPLAMDDQTIL